MAPSLSLLMESWTFPESALRYCTKASTHTLRNSEVGLRLDASARLAGRRRPDDLHDIRIAGAGVIVTRGEPASSPACALIWKMCVKFEEA